MKKIFTVLTMVIFSSAILFAAASAQDTFNFTLEYEVTDAAIASFTQDAVNIDITPFKNNPGLELTFGEGTSVPSVSLLTAKGSNDGYELPVFHVNFMLRTAAGTPSVTLKGSPLKNDQPRYIDYHIAITKVNGAEAASSELVYSASNQEQETTVTLNSSATDKTNGYITWGSYSLKVTTGLVPEDATPDGQHNFSATLTVGVTVS